jgi:ribonuclease HII
MSSVSSSSTTTTKTVPNLISQAMAQTIESLIDEYLLHRINERTENFVVASISNPAVQQHQPKRKMELPIYSIVDGHKSPATSSFKKYTIPCRPYKRGDAFVYTIALASCMARHLHELYMDSMSTIYPQYQFHIHGGYPTTDHIQAIHEYGVQPNIHRTSCTPVQNVLYNYPNGNTGILPLNPTLPVYGHDDNDNEIYHATT